MNKIRSFRDVLFARLFGPQSVSDTNLDTCQKLIVDQQRMLIDDLRALVNELLPFMLTDVRNGLWLGPPPEGHNDNCPDCEWYRESLSWKERIDNGEFGDISSMIEDTSWLKTGNMNDNR